MPVRSWRRHRISELPSSTRTRFGGCSMAAEKTYARFEMSRLVAEQLVGDRPYLEFLRHDTMSVGLYVLEAGATDLQEPHAEDELYYVVEGRAVLEVDGDQRPVQPGTL